MLIHLLNRVVSHSYPSAAVSDENDILRDAFFQPEPSAEPVQRHEAICTILSPLILVVRVIEKYGHDLDLVTRSATRNRILGPRIEW